MMPSRSLKLSAPHPRIAEYWPEFGVLGKGATTVADLMRHEAGLVCPGLIDPEDCLTENIKQNKVIS